MMWYTVEDGRIHRIQCAKLPTEDGEWKKAPDGWLGDAGDKLEWFDSNMNRIPDDELIKRGIRLDKRGVWFNKVTRETKQIYNLDESIDEDIFTKEIPIENEPYQIYDKEKNKWIVDIEKKELADKQNKLGQLKSEIAAAEQKQIRPLKLIIENKAKKEDTAIYNKYETIIETLRPEVTKLENELKSA